MFGTVWYRHGLGQSTVCCYLAELVYRVERQREMRGSSIRFVALGGMIKDMAGKLERTNGSVR